MFCCRRDEAFYLRILKSDREAIKSVEGVEYGLHFTSHIIAFLSPLLNLDSKVTHSFLKNNL